MPGTVLEVMTTNSEGLLYLLDRHAGVIIMVAPRTIYVGHPIAKTAEGAPPPPPPPLELPLEPHPQAQQLRQQQHAQQQQAHDPSPWA